MLTDGYMRKTPDRHGYGNARRLQDIGLDSGRIDNILGAAARETHSNVTGGTHRG